MKKWMVIVLAVVATLLCMGTSVAFADGVKTENDINLTDWTIETGENPAEAVGEGGAKIGVYLIGSGNGELFSYAYEKEFSPYGVMLDFLVDTENINYAASPCVEFLFGQQNKEFFAMSFTFFEDGYNAVLTVGDEQFVSEEMKYKEDGHIQFRIAKEEVKDYESGNSYVTWNYILGIQKKSTSSKNDKYNLRKNLYDDGEFKRISDALDLAVTGETARMKVVGSSKADCSLGLTVKQVSYFCFYDYSVLSNSYISTEKLDYTNVDFRFSKPENLEEFGGFVIERYKNGTFDKSFTITSSFAESFSDSKLKQDTDYKYVITALKNVSATNRIACTTIAFKYEGFTVHTTKGYLWKLIVGISAIVVACIAFVVCYVYFYDIKKLIKR